MSDEWLNMTREQFDKLPLYAQKELVTLRMRLDEVKTQLKDKQSNKETLVCMPYANGIFNGAVYLDDEQTYRFLLGKEHWNYIDINHRRTEIEVFGGDRLRIMPSVSNVVKMKIDVVL